MIRERVSGIHRGEICSEQGLLCNTRSAIILNGKPVYYCKSEQDSNSNTFFLKRRGDCILLTCEARSFASEGRGFVCPNCLLTRFWGSQAFLSARWSAISSHYGGIKTSPLYVQHSLSAGRYVGLSHPRRVIQQPSMGIVDHTLTQGGFLGR
ncbi:hypothetical protein Plhal304r1_c003g0010991 [Plasmopara halstedii]